VGVVTAEKTLRSDARRNLELILQAAGEAFAEHGLEVGVADIARRAGVGSATIFRRFPTKDDLVAAVFEARLHEIVGIARSVAEQEPGMDALRSFFEQAIEFQIRDKGFLENVGKRAFADDPRFAAATEEIFTQLDRIVAGAKAAGELREDVQTADLPVLLQAVCSGALLTTGGDEKLYRRYLEIILDGLRPQSASELSCPAPTLGQITSAKKR
jgi:AcrR family transcriptional regulator